MKDNVKVPKKWLARLLELKRLIDSEKNPVIKQGWIAHLLGYIASAEYLINKE